MFDLATLPDRRNHSEFFLFPSIFHSKLCNPRGAI